MKTLMFDTNIFNHILDGDIDITEFVDQVFLCVTHIQQDELNNTKDVERRAKLVSVFEDLIQKQVPTESFVLDSSRLGEGKLGGGKIVPTESAVWGVSRWGQAKWTAEDNLYSAIRLKLDQRNKSKPNNIQDALIAETAIKNGYWLITHDSNLYQTVTEFGGACANLEFVRQVLLAKV